MEPNFTESSRDQRHSACSSSTSRRVCGVSPAVDGTRSDRNSDDKVAAVSEYLNYVNGFVVCSTFSGLSPVGTAQDERPLLLYECVCVSECIALHNRRVKEPPRLRVAAGELNSGGWEFVH